MLLALSSILMVAYILHYQPLSTTFANRMEVMNECTTLCLIYGHVSFALAHPDPDYFVNGGFYYIGIIALNMFVHLVTMLLLNVYLCRLRCKRYLTSKATILKKLEEVKPKTAVDQIERE